MFQDIKLDDRSFDQIKDEVIANIVAHCPEWTNHNASDPGITLVELFAYMTEMTQYRLNRIPQKNYLAFLDLLGIKQRLPIAATSRVQFDLSAGYQMQESSKTTVHIPAFTQVATEGDDENPSLVYETIQSTELSNVKLLNLYSRAYEASRSKSHIYDYSSNIDSGEAFFPFSKVGKSDNKVELIFFSQSFYALSDDVRMSILFRLPTTMRQYDLTERFLSDMLWEYYDGTTWQKLTLRENLDLNVDETDADILTVTFEGNCENLEKSKLSQFSKDEQYFIKATLQETPDWLHEFNCYEVSVISNSNEDGVLADSCFYNYENLDLNSAFYPFGIRPTLEEGLSEENFYIQCDQAFCEANGRVEIKFDHVKAAQYTIPVGYDNLQLAFEYAVKEGKWKRLSVDDRTLGFTQEGSIKFTVPSDFKKVVLNAEEGYWIRIKIAAGNYGKEEENSYDSATGALSTTPATLNPPMFSSMNIFYSKEREDLSECYSFHNYQYAPITFDKNRPIHFFQANFEKEEALYFGFDSYLSEQHLELYFDIEQSEGVVENQRVLQWQVLRDGKWQRLKVEDNTHGLSQSGDIKITLPLIEKLEPYSLYIDTFDRMWIKASVAFNALKTFKKINKLSLNTVEVRQQTSFYNELLGHSDGLPNMKYTLEHGSLISAPQVMVEDVEYMAVERFIDYGAKDPVFRFNAILGEVEFGDGEYGLVPKLGSEIVVSRYQVSEGKAGNLALGKIRVLQEALNYVDRVRNIENAKYGQDGDTIEQVKRFAPTVLKSMQRAVTFEDYEHLSLNYSPFIKRVKALMHHDELIILVMTHSILSEKGFINKTFLKNLQGHLEALSMVTLHPIVQNVQLCNIKLKLKLKYSNDEDAPIRSRLEGELLETAQRYFNPLLGLEGSDIGRTLLKSDIAQIVHETKSSLLISELTFIKEGVTLDSNSVALAFNEIVYIEDLVIEELSYDF
jgi:hypothetical protein